MSAILQTILTYTLLPVMATIVGGAIATFRPPTPRVSSGIQHFAAGVVFAAVATELLPEIAAAHALLPTAVGFAIGVLLMLAVKAALHGRAHEEESHAEHCEAAAAGVEPFPSTLIVTVGVDIFIDGLLIGVGFAAGEEVGILLTIALTLELLFLGLSVAAALTGARVGKGKTLLLIAGLALLALLGALLGGALLGFLSGGALVATLAFGAAALLYLVTEELLIEAHEVEETPLITAMFFLGFFLLFALDLL